MFACYFSSFRFLYFIRLIRLLRFGCSVCALIASLTMKISTKSTSEQRKYLEDEKRRRRKTTETKTSQTNCVYENVHKYNGKSSCRCVTTTFFGRNTQISSQRVHRLTQTVMPLSIYFYDFFFFISCRFVFSRCLFLFNSPISTLCRIIFLHNTNRAK